MFIGEDYVQVCWVNDGQKKPVIILGHGLGGDSSQMLSTGRALADAGFFVLMPDAPSHGQTKNAAPSCLVEVVKASSRQYDQLLDTFQDDPNADTARVGAAGFSMGAMTAFYFAANSRHTVTAIGPCCGTPDFMELIGQNVAYLHCPAAGSFGEGAYADPARQKEMDRLLQEASPMDKLLCMPDLHVFMQNGEEDAFFSLRAVARLADNGENAELRVLAGQGHIYTEDMRRQMADFFVRVFLSK